MSADYFASKAAGYEKVKTRVANVDTIAQSILKKINFDTVSEVMDFGSGTGLLLERIAPAVDKIVAVDISKSMNEQLMQKKDSLDCELEIAAVDLSKANLDQNFDGIISSMTMHHVDDIDAMFAKFYSMLKAEGFIAIADLDCEDGSFHTEDTGVFHFGFDREVISKVAVTAGFKEVDIMSASTISKPQGSYPVFLLTATK